MFKQTTKDTINGWGQVFRVVTPILLTIALWMMTDVKSDIKEIRATARELAAATTIYNTNHLAHHARFETNISERMASIETLLRKQ